MVVRAATPHRNDARRARSASARKNENGRREKNLTIDVNTGLPELPEGYFFRVAKRSTYSEYYYVTVYRKVKKKRFFFWTYEKDVEQIFNNMIHPTLNERNIRDAAYKCVQDWDNWKARDTSLLGDYPPKKLGA